jgi:L-malate glycosyltransferase
LRKIRILFVMLQLDAGGSERVVLDLVRSLDAGRYEPYVAAFKGGALAAPLQAMARKVFLIDKKKRLDFTAMGELAGIIRKNRIDLVNAHHYMPCFYSFPGARILNRKKLVYTEHSVPEVEEVAGGIHGRIFTCMLSGLHAVIGVSREITAKFKESYPGHQRKFLTLANGVDIERFKERGSREEIRRRWGLAERDFVVGVVANFRRVKNHLCLVQAVARLRDSYPQVRLLLAGAGFPGDQENSLPEVDSAIRASGLENRVIMAGYQDNVPELLQAMDLFCLPSLSEGLPVSLLEAMAAGIPVIGSRVRGITEVVRHGETGLLFPANDPEALAKIIEASVLESEQSRRMAEKAFAYVEANHALGAWIAGFEKIMQL